VYVHVLHSPLDSRLVLPTLPVKVVKAAVLHGGDVAFEQTADTFILNLPPSPTGTIDTVVKLELAESWTTSAVIPVPAQ
jgi:alpha-L-fucosidase